MGVKYICAFVKMAFLSHALVKVKYLLYTKLLASKRMFNKAQMGIKSSEIKRFLSPKDNRRRERGEPCMIN